MKFDKLAFGLTLLSTFAMAGCGNGVDDDPLAGTWGNTACFGASAKPADIESCSTELTFTNELDIELKSTWISLAATATHPGCTTTWQVTGQQWSAEHAADTFTVTGKGASTIARSDCVNAEDDLEPITTKDLAIPEGKTEYTISGDTLTIQSGALSGTYAR